MSRNVIDAAIEYIEELFRDNADGHDAQHSLRVYRNAQRLLESYPDCDSTVVILASLLHDADDHKLFHTEHNSNARAFLAKWGVDRERTERICEIINAVSFSKNRGKRPESIEGMIVQDADRLDAMGAIGIARTFAFGGKHDRSMESSVQHFYDKLLLLKDELNTPEAIATGQIRHDYMVDFLRRLREETE